MLWFFFFFFFFLHEGILATQKTVCFGSKIYTGLKKNQTLVTGDVDRG